MTTKPSLVEIAKIVSAHGIKGQVKLKSMTVNPVDFQSYGELTYADGSDVGEIRVTGEAKGVLIATFENVKTRNDAEAMKGKSIFVDPATLPDPEEDEYYAKDLAGLEVRLSDGTVFGTVKALLDFGAGELLEIEGAKNKLSYYPFTLEAFPKVSVSEGWIEFVAPAETTSQDEDGKVH